MIISKIFTPFSNSLLNINFNVIPGLIYTLNQPKFNCIK